MPELPNACCALIWLADVFQGMPGKTFPMALVLANPTEWNSATLHTSIIDGLSWVVSIVLILSELVIVTQKYVFQHFWWPKAMNSTRGRTTGVFCSSPHVLGLGALWGRVNRKSAGSNFIGYTSVSTTLRTVASPNDLAESIYGVFGHGDFLSGTDATQTEEHHGDQHGQGHHVDPEKAAQS